MAKNTGNVGALGEATLGKTLKFLAPEEIADFCSYLEYRVCEPGEILMKDGDPGDFMGFVLDGKLAEKKETNFPGRFTLVGILDSGALVGEISAVECGGVRTATVAAMQRTEMLLLSCANLDKLLAEHPNLGIKLLRRIIHVLSLRQGRAYDRLSSLL